MKNYLITFLLCIPILAISQGEKFIKIVGIANLEVPADDMRIKLTVTEIARDEYQKIREKSLEEVKLELDANLKTLGYSINDLEEIWPPKRNYKKVEATDYFLNVKSIEDAKQITKFSIKGFSAQGFEYVYNSELEFDDYEMAKMAMSDAKRKAEALAKHVGKKVGDVINIEDMASSKKRFIGSKKGSTSNFNYKLVITYELLD